MTVSVVGAGAATGPVAGVPGAAVRSSVRGSSSVPDSSPAEPEPLQAVGDRVEQVGEREPGNEGQEDVAQDEQGEHRDREGRDPERHLPLEGHRPAINPGVRRPAQAAMWRIHRAR